MIGPAMSSKEAAEIVRRHQDAETASVTNIDSARPNVQSAHYQFTSEDEAQMFVQWAREDLDAHESYDYVDHDVYDSPDIGGWGVRIDYIHTAPKTPEAA